MGTIPTTGALSINNCKVYFGGTSGTQTSMSQLYRGQLCPSSIREPTSGEYYTSGYYWYIAAFFNDTSIIVWAGSTVYSNQASNATSVTTGGYTYYRGTFKLDTTDGKSSTGGYEYAVYRTQSINTGVPSSGTIAISNLRGATYL